MRDELLLVGVVSRYCYPLKVDGSAATGAGDVIVGAINVDAPALSATREDVSAL